MKCLTKIFAKFSPSENNHVYSIPVGSSGTCQNVHVYEIKCNLLEYFVMVFRGGFKKHTIDFVLYNFELLGK